MEKKNNLKKYIFTIFILFTTLVQCKESNSKKTDFTKNIVANENVYQYAEVNFDKKSNYTGEIKSLEIRFQKFNFIFNLIEDRTYLQYNFNNSLLSNWEQVSYNFSYESSFQIAENEVKILYNNKKNKGYLLLPGYTNEYPIYNVYEFNEKEISYKTNISLNQFNCLNEKTEIKASETFNKLDFGVYDNSNKLRCHFTQIEKDELIKKNENIDIQKITQSLSKKNDYLKLLDKNVEYFAQDDKLDDFGISIQNKNDSLIYTETGDMGKMYNQFLLKTIKFENNKLHLQIKDIITGYEGDALKNSEFGVLINDNGKIYFESDYLFSKYGVRKVLLYR